MIKLKLKERRAPTRLRLRAQGAEPTLRERMYGLNPSGSWENTRDQLQLMVSQSDKFGGPVVPYGVDEENYEAIRPGDISIEASYPGESKVLVSNYRTGEYFMLPFTIGEDGKIDLGDPAPAALEVSAKTKEAIKAMRESGRRGARGYPVQLDVRITEASKIGKDGSVEVMAIRVGTGNPVDKNYYDKGFIESIVPLLAANRSFRDHPTLFEENNIPERSVDRLAGWFSDERQGTWMDPEHPELGEVEAAFATFHPVVDDTRTINLLRTCAEMHAKYPDKEPFVAFSINAYGVGAPGEIDGNQYNIVSKCTELRSVDMVTQAGAAGRPMMESSKHMNRKKTSESGKRIDPKLPARTSTQIAEAKAQLHLESTRAAVRDLLAGPMGKALVEASGEKPDAAGNFTNDQVDKIASKAGFVKGGKMHQALEDALVDDDQDPEPEETPPGDPKTEGDEELTPEKIDAMTDAEKTAALKKSIGAQEAGGKTAREIKLEKQLSETNARLEKLEGKISEADRKTVFTRVCDEHKIPAVYRPLIERLVKDATSNDEIAELVQSYKDAHIVESGRGGFARGIDDTRVREGRATVAAPRFERAAR